MNKILIIGGAAFLGSHLTERLLREGNDVLVADNFFAGNIQNLVHLMGNPNLEIMRHDVTFPLYVEVNQIYNLECPASPCTINTIPCKPLKLAYTAPLICWVWRSAREHVFCKPLRVGLW